MQPSHPADGQACMLDANGTIVWTNRAWERHGSPLPASLGLADNYLESCRRADLGGAGIPQLADAIESVLHGTNEHVEVEITSRRRSPDGCPSYYQCLVRAQSVPIDSDRRILLTHQDITHSRLATAALHASEERYRQFFEAAPDAVFLLSGDPKEDGRILDANSLAAQMHGYSREELLKMKIGELDVEEDAELVEQRIKTLNERGSITFTVTHLRRDGSEFPVEVSARKATIGGKPCIVSYNRDISERQEYEDALRENKMRIDLAARASQVGFWHWDLEDNSVIFSPEWKAQIGYEPHEIRDDFEEWRSRVHPEDLEPAMQAVTNHIEGRTPEYTTEFRFRHKDGSYRWIYVRGEISRDQDGNPIRFVGCHVDITANKQAEEERERLTQRINQLQRIEAIGTLAGGIAHDFNNILSIIGGNVELAMMATDDPPLVESLDEIHKASKRAESLVRQVLSFSREEAPERQRVELGTIVKEAARLTRSTTPQRVTIQTDIDADIPATFADPEQLHQVLVNLGTNAFHAIGDGSGQVTFRVTSGPLPKHLVADQATANDQTFAILEVTDDGEGMSEERRSRIFEPFFTTKETGKGTGLGLSVVHGIIKTHEGVIDVDSTPGVGTTFRIYLPPHTETESPTPMQTPLPSGEGLHVLLVDDEPNLLRVLTRGLERLGFQVTALDDPKAAIEAIRAAPDRFDAFVTDYDMPGLNGIESTRLIRELRQDLPILLCSGFMDTDATDEANEAGVSLLLTKPIRAKHLAETICSVRTS